MSYKAAWLPLLLERVGVREFKHAQFMTVCRITIYETCCASFLVLDRIGIYTNCSAISLYIE